MTAPTKVHSTRLVAPDVARGLALLGIALANIPTVWLATNWGKHGEFFGGVVAGEGTVAENIAIVFSAMFVHVRGLPMFATLLGFGIGLIAMSLWRRGFPLGNARATLLRRYGFLALFGAIHLVFLFPGDIMMHYGLIGLLLIGLLSLKDKVLLLIAYTLLGLAILACIFLSFLPGLSETYAGVDIEIMGSSTYSGFLVKNLIFLGLQLIGIPMVAGMTLPLMIIGFVWARRGVLDDVPAHRTQLLTWVGLGSAVVVLIGAPWGLATIGVLPAELEGRFQILNAGFGLLTGPGILAAVVLAVQGIQKKLRAHTDYRLPLPMRMVMALGQRSMSGYIMQSIILLVITQPFFIGWGQDTGVLGKMALGFGVWLATVILAFLWEMRGWPGPFEWAHRRLSYGKQGLPDRFELPAQRGV